ncbi:transposase-like protein [Sulfitobacter geojensis]|nr:transposase-like protein [Sulfitobacter geojensis]
MGQVRHGCATTTHAVRAAIQRSQATNAALSRELGINVKTVSKWRKRETLEVDLSRFRAAPCARLAEAKGRFVPPNDSLAVSGGRSGGEL